MGPSMNYNKQYYLKSEVIEQLKTIQKRKRKSEKVYWKMLDQIY